MNIISQQNKYSQVLILHVAGSLATFATGEETYIHSIDYRYTGTGYGEPGALGVL